MQLNSSKNIKPLILHYEDKPGLVLKINKDKATIRFLGENEKYIYNIEYLHVNEKNSPWTCKPDYLDSYKYVIEDVINSHNWKYGDARETYQYKSPITFTSFKKAMGCSISRAMNIDFQTEYDRIDSIAFLAAYEPHIYAIVYEGDSLDDFMQNHPTAYDKGLYHIDTSNALIRCTHFNIGISTQESVYAIMPEPLKLNLSSQGNKINRTAFVQDLIDCGFQFGDNQDIEQIKIHMQKEPEYELFLERYNTYKDLMKNLNLHQQKEETNEELEK